ncbi:MAG: NADH-quinone oxidoreductase subunit A [Bacteroidetes bacterium]|nr:NADH-quinone oxidoreductase subunit A [Bacteroidota bacterium]
MEQQFFPSDYFTVFLQSLVVLGFVATTMLATHYIGGKRKKFHSIRKDQNFECGIEIKGNARFPFSVKYFLIAILFVLFDVEIIFFYPWAVNFKEFGWNGFWEMLIFLGFVLFGFWYVLKKGALKWEE